MFLKDTPEFKDLRIELKSIAKHLASLDRHILDLKSKDKELGNHIADHTQKFIDIFDSFAKMTSEFKEVKKKTSILSLNGFES